MPNEAEERLETYLETIQPKDWPRVTCCDSSRSFYCPECCRLLIPSEDWPDAIREGSLRFPFDIDIILDAKERRTSATGIHVVAISAAVDDSSSSEGHKLKASTNLSEENTSDSRPQKSVCLYDLKQAKLQSYEPFEKGTYVLFPDKGSVPISSVASEIDKLIVLDIKWSKQSVKMDPTIASLPKVHLDSPPAQSHFWRWHNAGQGMLSTVEAIYFAAMEAALDWTPAERERLIHIMWLFALQRSVVHVQSELEQRPPPFTEEGKEIQRVLRKLQFGNPPKKKLEEEEKFYKDLS